MKIGFRPNPEASGERHRVIPRSNESEIQWRCQDHKTDDCLGKHWRFHSLTDKVSAREIVARMNLRTIFFKYRVKPHPPGS